MGNSKLYSHGFYTTTAWDDGTSNEAGPFWYRTAEEAIAAADQVSGRNDLFAYATTVRMVTRR